MRGIDSQMLQMYQKYTQGSSDQGKKISEDKAEQLIRRAGEVNNTSSSSFGENSKSHRGDKSLTKLFTAKREEFSPESQKMIQQYLRSGQTPSTGGQATSGHGASQPSDTTTGHHHRHGVGHGDASGPSHSTPSHNRPGIGNGNVAGPSHPAPGNTRPGVGNGNVIAGPSPATPGITRPAAGNGNVAGPSPAIPGNTRPGAGNGNVAGPSHPTDPAAGTRPGTSPGGVSGPAVPNPVGDVGTIGPNGKVILDFQASKKTWECHWFPMQETRPGGDPVNNLYAVGGPLDKLDMVTGGNARGYENSHNRKAYNAGKEYSWWGHCNNASEAACILQAPRHSVMMTAKDGSEVKFTRGDIQGLLVKVSSSLVNKVDFKGERFNDASRDDPNEPSPEFFINVMQEWAKDGIPFVLDIDRKEQVWNFPYDQVKITESGQAPSGFTPTGLPTDGSVKYYHIEMSGTGFDEKKRIYESYVQRDSSGGAVASAWINTPNTNNNPDFMWRPHPIGDLMDKATWQLRGSPSNPEVDPQLIYEIYMKSLG